MARYAAMFVALAALAGFPLPAQVVTTDPVPCAAVEVRDFDFMVGRWLGEEKRVSGGDTSVVATADIDVRPVLDGCALQEHWTIREGEEVLFTAMLLRAFDVEHGQWMLSYVDDHLRYQVYTGRRDGDGWAFYRERESDGTPLLIRIAWRPSAPGFRQTIERSRDQGRTWQQASHVDYVRRLPVSVFGPGTISEAGNNLYRGSFAPDGRAFYFFRKVTEDREDYRIFVSRRVGDGWGEPVRVVLAEDGHPDLYPNVSPDGRRLVFTSYRPVPGDTSAHPNANVWLAEWSGEGWGDPVLLDSASTLANYDAGPWFDRDGRIHFVSISPDWRTRTHRVSAPTPYGYGRWRDDPLLEPWAEWRDDVYVWDGTPSPDGTLMVLGVSPLHAQGERGPPDLWVSVRGPRGWSEPVKLGPEINSPTDTENFVVFSPDGREMLFVRGFSTYYRVPVTELLASVAGR